MNLNASLRRLSLRHVGPKVEKSAPYDAMHIVIKLDRVSRL